MARGLGTLITMMLALMASTVSAQSLRAMTYNIQYDNGGYTNPAQFWENRAGTVLAKLANENADVLAVQEMYDCGKPPTADVIGQVRSTMLGKGYGEQFYPRTYPGNPAADPKAYCGKFRSWIFYNKARFEELEANAFPQYDGDSRLVRYAPWIKLRDKRTHRVLRVVGFHALPNDSKNDSLNWDGPAARLNEVENLLEATRSMGDVLIMGDFNIARLRDTSTCPDLIAKYDRRNSVPLALSEMDGISFCLMNRAYKDVLRTVSPGTATGKIDYIWASAGIAARSAAFSTVTTSNAWLDQIQNGVRECGDILVMGACFFEGLTKTAPSGAACVCRVNPFPGSDHQPLSAELHMATVGRLGPITVVDGKYYFHFLHGVDQAGNDAGEPFFCDQTSSAGGNVAMVSSDMIPAAQDRDGLLESLLESRGDPTLLVYVNAAESSGWGCLVTDVSLR